MWLPSSTQSVSGVSEDLELTLRARRALLKPETSAGQTVGVSVRNRVATLWGTVSSPDMARRAEACLGNLPGLTAVRNELSVEAHGSQRDRQVLPRAQARVLSGEPPPLTDTQPVQGALVHRGDEQRLTASQQFSWRPVASNRAGLLPAPPKDRSVEGERMSDKPVAECLPGFPSPDSALTSSRASFPVRVEKTALATSAAGNYPTAPLAVHAGSTGSSPSPAKSPAGSSLVERIEALRLDDSRFRRVRVEVSGDTVSLHGTVDRWDHVFELARSIARLPGVRRVLFDKVQEAPP